MIKKLTYFLIIFVVFISGCGSGIGSTGDSIDEKKPDIPKVLEGFLIVGQNGIINKMTNDNDYSNVNVPINLVNSSAINSKGLLVAVGESGTILTHMGTNYESGWSAAISGIYNDLLDIVVADNDIFVAVGNNGIILSSIDGKKWIQESSTTSYTLYGITKNKSGKLVAVGSNGTILYSNDGKYWQNASISISYNLYDIKVSKAGKFVTVGHQGIIYSSLDGMNWNKESSNTSSNLTKIAVNESGLIVVTGDNSTALYYAESKWNSGALPEGHLVNSLDVNKNGTFIGVSSNGRIAKSTNGTSWVAESVQNIYLRSVIADKNGKFIVFSDSGIIFTSNAQKNESWINYRITPNLNSLFEMTRYKNKTYTVGFGTILSSIDNINWVRESIPINNVSLNDIVGYKEDKIVAVGDNGIILSSRDGSTWQKESSNISVKLAAVTVDNNGKFVAVGYAGTILSSRDGSIWKKESAPFYNWSLNDIVFSKDNKFIAVGNNGTIFISTDGSTWENKSFSNVNNRLFSIINKPDGGVLVVGDSLVMSSPDGLVWDIYENILFRGYIWNVAVNSLGKFVAVGDYGRLFTFDDGGLNYFEIPKMNNLHLYGIMAVK